jgi:hypothetical protein
MYRLVAFLRKQHQSEQGGIKSLDLTLCGWFNLYSGMAMSPAELIEWQQTLAAGLSQGIGLEVLHLSYDTLETEGGLAILRALVAGRNPIREVHIPLKKLDGAAAGQTLAYLVRESSQLALLNVAKQPILGQAGVGEATGELLEQQSVRLLRVDGAVFPLLAVHLPKMEPLQKLVIEGNFEWGPSLREAFYRNHGLEEVTLDEGFSPPARQEIYDFLWRNRALRIWKREDVPRSIWPLLLKKLAAGKSATSLSCMFDILRSAEFE